MIRRPLLALLVLLPGLADSPLPAAPLDFFANDADTVLRLEFTQSVADLSGGNRHPVQHSNVFVDGAFGYALRIEPPDDPLTTAVGFDWSAYAHLLVPPFTVEMLLVDFVTGGYEKLLSGDDAADAGWYLNDGQFRSYPEGDFFEGVPDGELFYLALVVREVEDAAVVDIWIDGVLVGTSPNFDVPPADAVFFRDDTANSTSRPEQFDGTVDALRISDRARSPSEIAAIHAASRVVFRNGFEGGCFEWSDFQGLTCVE